MRLTATLLAIHTSLIVLEIVHLVRREPFALIEVQFCIKAVPTVQVNRQRPILGVNTAPALDRSESLDTLLDFFEKVTRC